MILLYTAGQAVYNNGLPSAIPLYILILDKIIGIQE